MILTPLLAGAAAVVSAAMRTPITDAIKVPLTTSQRRCAAAIEMTLRNEFHQPATVIQAAIANAKGESNLNPRSIGDHGHSFGVFQLNVYGAAHGIKSPSALLDAVTNTRVIAQRELMTKAGEATRKALTATAATEAWCRDIERPADIPGEVVKRVSICRKFWPASELVA